MPALIGAAIVLGGVGVRVWQTRHRKRKENPKHAAVDDLFGGRFGDDDWLFGGTPVLDPSPNARRPI